jgi:glycosyltransferase involved in cell wall biosynthesis
MDIFYLPRNTQLVIFWRTSLDYSSMPWFSEARSNGVQIAYDNDDLTFDPNVYNVANVNALSLIPQETAEFLVNIITPKQQKQVSQSDIGLACTPRIADSFSQMGVETISIPIVIPRWMERQSREILRFKISDNGETLNSASTNIFYASGSPSHHADFLVAKQGLFRYLTEYTSATFTIIGSSPLASHEIPSHLRDQVKFEGMVSHSELLETISKFNLQIAPLELPNPFTEAKSATKFMQGGILKIPTIASPSEPFRKLIRNHVNGLLASNEEEWYAAFVELTDPRMRKRMGLNALETVNAECTIDSIASNLVSLLPDKMKVTKYSELKGSGAKRKISWLVPDYSANSGGIRNILKLSKLAEKMNYECEIVFHSTSYEISQISKMITVDYALGSFNVAKRVTREKSLHAVVSVHHSSVPYMKSHTPHWANLVYLVQDFEPFFYPMSEKYLEALDSYFDTQLNVITSLKWMSRKILDISGRTVPYLDFPMDKNVYNGAENHNREGIIFFAKDDTPRRLYSLGVSALQIVRQVDPLIPITFFGGGPTPSEIDNINNLGKLDTVEELAWNYRRHLVGLSFAPTNPSGIPYEMMACGLPVVDVNLPGSLESKYFDDRVKLVKPSPKAVASEILKLLGSEKYWIETSNKGLLFTNEMDPEIVIQRTLEDFLNSLR